MLVAITRQQWTGLVAALALEKEIASLEAELGLSFSDDEGARFLHRDRLVPLVEKVLGALPRAEVAARFDKHGVCWDDYRTLKQALANDPRLSVRNPLLAPVMHPSGYEYLAPGAAASIPSAERGLPSRAPQLGEHTDQVLAEVLWPHRPRDRRASQSVGSSPHRFEEKDGFGKSLRHDVFPALDSIAAGRCRGSVSAPLAAFFSPRAGRIRAQGAARRTARPQPPRRTLSRTGPCAWPG